MWGLGELSFLESKFIFMFRISGYSSGANEPNKLDALDELFDYLSDEPKFLNGFV